MTWFKVDDGLHSHKKAVRAGVPAMGLWVLAGTWCADQLTDGWVPDYIAARLDPDYEVHAAALVKAGLWVPGEQFENVRANDGEHVRANDGEHGWWFHEWGAHQPSAESVLAKRDEAKERMTRLREARRAANSAGQEDRGRSGSVRANTSRTSREVRSTPTRPDPTRTKEQKPPGDAAPRRTRATNEDPAFTRFWEAYPRKEGKKDAHKAWPAAVKAANGDAEAIITAAERYRGRRHNQDPQFTKTPTAWLNGERWNDEPTTPLRVVGSATGGSFWNN